MEKGLKVIGVPKTIDNDICGTTASFGFDTAANTAMEALDKLHTTAESHHRVIILEVMGREAGWIALKAGIAGGADVILIPEIPYDFECILDEIRERGKRGAKFSIIVVAEGAFPQGGQPIYQKVRETGAARRLGGIGEALADQLRDHTNEEVRVTVLGHLQRGGSPSSFDRLLASRFGVMAVHQIAAGNFGSMVALDRDNILAIPLVEAVKGTHYVPLDSDILLTAKGLDICLGVAK
jgi:6-phosphofructokinase